MSATISMRNPGLVERVDEPVTLGVPLARGWLADPARALLRGTVGVIPVQTTALARWPDGSVRWLLLDWLASLGAGESCELTLEQGGPGPAPPAPVRVSEHGAGDPSHADHAAGAVTIDTGAARFTVSASALQAAVGGVPVLARSGLDCRLAGGARLELAGARLQVLERGPIRATVRVEGELRARGTRLLVSQELRFFSGSARVELAVAVTNPRRARHPGGYWELGDPGSVLLEELALAFTLAGDEPVTLALARDLAAAQPEPAALPLELYQDSSGGDAWQSLTHVERDGRPGPRFRGYRLRAGGREELVAGRATPCVVLASGPRRLAFAMRHFWQSFPKAIAANQRTLAVGLFPAQAERAHELQGGERKTHRLALDFAPGAAPLLAHLAPLRPVIAPLWTAATGAVRALVPAAQGDPRYEGLVMEAVAGRERFEVKRERADTYGWRHFGELPADHEAQYHSSGGERVSHYNNQYDAIAAFGVQFLRTGDVRFFELMDELAAHVADIDRYHTTEDKAAYNGGLFWHTAHYVDAGRATHRSYPRAPGVPGGGPSNEHNYSHGLLLHHWLTGNGASREAALGLAQWVLAMDDGARTVFRVLAHGRTGLATASGSPDYHGPGRGGGNSIAVLLDAYAATGEARWLAKAEELVLRCVHPEDDLAALDLGNAEQRWFYTVFLQSLAALLESKAEHGALDATYAYARAALLHYARWMAEHEQPYLAHRERLEYPTETWAAQELRKCEVLDAAARHAAEPSERGQLRERAEYFYVTALEQLEGFATRTQTRPLVLALRLGWRHAWARAHPEDLGAPVAPASFPAKPHFEPQKRRAIRRARRLAIAGAAASVAAAVGLLLYLW